MTNFKPQYKNIGFSFGDPEQQRLLRIYKQDKSRKEIRTQAFDNNRKLLDVSASSSPQTEVVSTTNDERMKKLQKWITERDKRKKLENAKKKPVFKVGVVHHSVCSPIVRNYDSTSVTITKSKQTKPPGEVKKRITRATEKRLLIKAAQTQSKPTTAVVKNSSTSSAGHSMDLNKAVTKKQKSFAPANHKFRPPSGLPNMPLFGLVPIEKTPLEKGDFFISKSTECNTVDANKEQNVLLKTPNTQFGDSNNKVSEYNKSTDSKVSSSKRNSTRLNKKMYHTNDNTSVSDKSSSPKQTLNKRNLSRQLNKKNRTVADTTSEFRKSNNLRSSSNKRNRSQISDKNISGLNDNKSTNLTLSNKELNEQKLNSKTENLNNTPSKLNNDVETPIQKRKLNSDLETSTQKNNSIDKSEKENYDENLIVFSPYLTISRGKSNARKEQQLRLGIGRSPSHEVPTKDTVMKNLNISIEEEERTAQYFKFLLNKETDKLKELCKKWLEIQQETDIPEDAVYEISQAVGQTNLLMNKKFERFRSLVLDCEMGRGEMLITCRDLQGFWDMTYIEVENCNMRFEKLEQRRNKGWEEEECNVIKPASKKQMPGIKKRMPAKKQVVSSKPSSLRQLILAAKKKMTETQEDSLPCTNINKERVTPSSISRKSVVYKENMGSTYNTRRSKSLDRTEFKSTPTRCDDSKTSLLKKVQYSETSKKLKSPYAIMKISQMCKTPEVQLDDTILYVNSNQTPAKSILKKSEKLINKEARIKSACKVNFDDHVVLNEMPVNEALQTKLNLAAALSRIDNLDLDELSVEESINAERKLDFDSTDSNSSAEWMPEILNMIKMCETKPGTKSEMKSLTQDISDLISGPFNDITSAESLKLSLPDDNLKIKSSRKSSRYRAQQKNMTNKKASVINVQSATSSNNNDAHLISEITADTTNVEQDHDFGARVLRNRTIMNDTPKINRTSKVNTPKRRDSSIKENKSPVKSKRKSLLKSLKKDGIKFDNENDKIETDKNIDKRRKSSRKSVAFTAETCLVCAENKPVLPMTPHSKRRSNTPSRQNRSRHTSDLCQDSDDLILWQTPERPTRVKRSHVKN